MKQPVVACCFLPGTHFTTLLARRTYVVVKTQSQPVPSCYRIEVQQVVETLESGSPVKASGKSKRVISQGRFDWVFHE